MRDNQSFLLISWPFGVCEPFISFSFIFDSFCVVSFNWRVCCWPSASVCLCLSSFSFPSTILRLLRPRVNTGEFVGACMSRSELTSLLFFDSSSFPLCLLLIRIHALSLFVHVVLRRPSASLLALIAQQQQKVSHSSHPSVLGWESEEGGM